MLTAMSKDPTIQWDFHPYAQLVAALLPRTAGLTICEPDGEVRWTSEEYLAPAFAPLIRKSAATAERSSEPGELVLLGRNEPLHVFWLRDDSGVVVALFAISWRAGEGESRTVAYVHSMLKPVLETLHRELMLRARLTGSTAASAQHEAD